MDKFNCESSRWENQWNVGVGVMRRAGALKREKSDVIQELPQPTGQARREEKDK
jgi:hypothetical protein